MNPYATKTFRMVKSHPTEETIYPIPHGSAFYMKPGDRYYVFQYGVKPPLTGQEVLHQHQKYEGSTLWTYLVIREGSSTYDRTYYPVKLHAVRASPVTLEGDPDYLAFEKLEILRTETPGNRSKVVLKEMIEWIQKFK